jgi:DNA-binding PadR family transcriptional regulator
MRTSLELFVLAMVQQGLGTPYELKTKAGLSLGSTVPVLARLAKDSLVKTSEEGVRRSRTFSITTKGVNVLTQGWREQLTTSPKDIDSILRIVYLAWLNGDNAAAVKFMKRSAQSLQGWASIRGAEADRLGAMIGEKPDGDTFMWLRTSCEAAQAGAEAQVLIELSARMSRRTRVRKKPVAFPGPKTAG